MSAVCPNGHTSDSEDYCDTCGTPIDASAITPSGSSPAGASGAPGATGTAEAPGVPVVAGGRSSLDLDPAPGGAAAGVTAAGEATPAGLDCPNCHVENIEGALFCEACGYDFTTGAMPRDPSAPQEPSPQSSEQATSDPSGPATPSSKEQSGAASGPPSSEQPAFEWVAEVWIDPDWYATQEAEDPCPSPGLPTIIPLRDRSVLMGRVSTSRNTHPEIDLSSDPGVSRRHAQLSTDGTRWFVEDLGSSNGTFVGAAAGPLPDKAISVGPRTELDADDRLYVGAWTRVVVRAATPDEVEAYA